MKSQSPEKMHHFLPGRPAFFVWTISKYFFHTVNSHQDVSLGWYKITITLPGMSQ